MKLYVCWGTFELPGGVRTHPCRTAEEALKQAGHRPKVIKTYSVGVLPPLTPGRMKVKQLTGECWVPVLETDSGEAIAGSKEIVAWAAANPPA